MMPSAVPTGGGAASSRPASTMAAMSSTVYKTHRPARPLRFRWMSRRHGQVQHEHRRLQPARFQGLFPPRPCPAPALARRWRSPPHRRRASWLAKSCKTIARPPNSLRQALAACSQRGMATVMPVAGCWAAAGGHQFDHLARADEQHISSGMLGRSKHQASLTPAAAIDTELAPIAV